MPQNQSVMPTACAQSNFCMVTNACKVLVMSALRTYMGGGISDSPKYTIYIIHSLSAT